MEISKKEIGKRIAEIRKSKNLKQEEFRELIGAPTVQMISNWENGHSFPSAMYLIIIAKKLDTSLDYLLLGKKNESECKEISTYKEAGKSIYELIKCGLFSFFYVDGFHNTTRVNLYSKDTAMYEFKNELSSLLNASSTLRPELFNQAIVDLLNKYDYPIEDNGK